MRLFVLLLALAAPLAHAGARDQLDAFGASLAARAFTLEDIGAVDPVSMSTPWLTKAEEQQVKLAAQSILKRLREEHPKVLIEGRHRDGQSQRRVKSAMEEVLDDKLPESYDRRDFSERCVNAFDLMVTQAANQGRTAAWV